MIIFGNCLLKVLKFFQNIHATNKSSKKSFVNEILHRKPINNKKQLTKPNTDEFKYEDDTEASAVEEIENESEGDIMMMVDLMIMAMMMMIMVMMVVMLKLMRLVIVAVMTLIVLMV